MHCITEVLSSQGNGNCEYLSMTVRKYSFLILDGWGPLNSMFSFSNGWVAFMNSLNLGLKNCGLCSAQIWQAFLFFTLSLEYSKILVCTIWDILIMFGWHISLCRAQSSSVLAIKLHTLDSVFTAAFFLPWQDFMSPEKQESSVFCFTIFHFLFYLLFWC